MIEGAPVMSSVRRGALYEPGNVTMSLVMEGDGMTFLADGEFARDPNAIDACLPQAALETAWTGALAFAH